MNNESKTHPAVSTLDAKALVLSTFSFHTLRAGHFWITTGDLAELVEQFKLLERSGITGAGNSYKLIGS